MQSKYQLENNNKERLNEIEINRSVGKEIITSTIDKNIKTHVSYSELTTWLLCQYKHKLVYLDKIGPEIISPHFAFGKAIHSGCEEFLTSKSIDVNRILEIINNDFELNKDKLEYSKFSKKQLNQNLIAATQIFDELPNFFDSTFENWKFISAEELLFEPINSTKNLEFKIKNFKGYIDAVIGGSTLGVTRKKDVTWILDFKTCGFGWKMEQKRDPIKRMQLALYKNFWAQKHNIDLKSIRCGFVLLKKQSKPGKRCELIQISVGNKTLQDAVNNIEKMITAVNLGVSMKNRTSCDRCEFYQTKFCT